MGDLATYISNVLFPRQFVINKDTEKLSFINFIDQLTINW